MEPNDEAMQNKELVVTFNSHFQSNHKQLNTRMCTHTTSVVVKGKISNDNPPVVRTSTVNTRLQSSGSVVTHRVC